MSLLVRARRFQAGLRCLKHANRAVEVEGHVYVRIDVCKREEKRVGYGVAHITTLFRVCVSGLNGRATAVSPSRSLPAATGASVSVMHVDALDDPAVLRRPAPPPREQTGEPTPRNPRALSRGDSAIRGLSIAGGRECTCDAA